MPKYRVLLDRKIVEPGERPRNPFLIRDIFSLPPSRYIVREFEFEARNEKHVKQLLDEAREQDLGEVRGFNLRSIEQLPHSAEMGR